MKVLNLLSTGDSGGIEVLCRNIGLNSNNQTAFCFLFGEGIIFEKMKKEGLKVMSFSDTKRISIKKSKDIVHLARDYDIIVAHHNDPFLQWYYLWLKNIYPEKKYILMRHSCYDVNVYLYRYNVVKRLIRKRIMIKAMNISDAIVFVSEAGKNSFEEYFDLSRKKCFVVYNGIDKEILKQGEKHAVSRDDVNNLVYIGRLYEGKGVRNLIYAVNKIKEKYKCHLYIVGEGPSKNDLQLMTQEMRLDKVVSFTGQKADIIPYLRKGSIFVYPSIVKEVFGISLVEAMSFGLICVSNSVGGIPEIIKNEKNGFLTEAPDEESLVKTLESAFNILNTEKEYTIRSNAKMTAKQFSIDETIISLENVFMDVFKND